MPNHDLKRYADNLRDELNGAELARAAPGPTRDALRAALRAADNRRGRVRRPQQVRRAVGRAGDFGRRARPRGRLQAIAQRSTGSRGVVTGADIARAEPWHGGASGNNLRAAVLGANDGLVSNFRLVMGVAGAGAANNVIC